MIQNHQTTKKFALLESTNYRRISIHIFNLEVEKSLIPIFINCILLVRVYANEHVADLALIMGLSNVDNIVDFSILLN